MQENIDSNQSRFSVFNNPEYQLIRMRDFEGSPDFLLVLVRTAVWKNPSLDSRLELVSFLGQLYQGKVVDLFNMTYRAYFNKQRGFWHFEPI